MSYDDLKVVEAKKFLSAFLGNEFINSNIHDAVASARVVEAAELSVETGAWQTVVHPNNTTAAKFI
jgi:hypothetical protein